MARGGEGRRLGIVVPVLDVHPVGVRQRGASGPRSVARSTRAPPCRRRRHPPLPAPPAPYSSRSQRVAKPWWRSGPAKCIFPMAPVAKPASPARWARVRSPWRRGAVRRRAVGVRVASGEQALPGRHAHRRGRVRVVEDDAVPRKSVQVGRVHPRIAQPAPRGGVVLVGHDHQHVAHTVPPVPRLPRCLTTPVPSSPAALGVRQHLLHVRLDRGDELACRQFAVPELGAPRHGSACPCPGRRRWRGRRGPPSWHRGTLAT